MQAEIADQNPVQIQDINNNNNNNRNIFSNTGLCLLGNIQPLTLEKGSEHV